MLIVSVPYAFGIAALGIFVPQDFPEPLMGCEGDSWVCDSDYPLSALREDRQGDVEFGLTVDETGKVSECWIIQSSGHSDLDRRTCQILLARAKFAPARDPDGNLIEGKFRSIIRWRTADNVSKGN